MGRCACHRHQSQLLQGSDPLIPCQCLGPSNGPTAFCETLGIPPLHLYTYKILQLHTVSIINYLHLCHSPAKHRHCPSCPPVPLVQEQERMHQDPQDPAPTNRPCCRLMSRHIIREVSIGSNIKVLGRWFWHKLTLWYFPLEQPLKQILKHMSN